MAKHRPTYTKEFKLAILAQVNSGIPVAQVARENGIHPPLVFKWKSDFLEDPEKAWTAPRRVDTLNSDKMNGGEA